MLKSKTSTYDMPLASSTSMSRSQRHDLQNAVVPGILLEPCRSGEGGSNPSKNLELYLCKCSVTEQRHSNYWGLAPLPPGGSLLPADITFALLIQEQLRATPMYRERTIVPTPRFCAGSKVKFGATGGPHFRMEGCGPRMSLNVSISVGFAHRDPVSVISWTCKLLDSLLRSKYVGRRRRQRCR